MTTPPRHKVVFVIHQIGSGADGGIRSISEMIRAVPDLDKLVVTNIESDVTRKLRMIAPVELWDMVEVAYHRDRSPLTRRAAQVVARLRNNLRAYRAIRRTGATILHANDHRAFWNTVLGAKAARARVILNVRDTMRVGGAVGQWRRALNLCDRFLVLSAEMVAAWRRDLSPTAIRHANRDKFAFLYSIVDFSRYHPVSADERARLREKLCIDPVRPAFAYVGRFDDKKAQLAFIERCLPAMVAGQPDAVVHFVGDFAPEVDGYAAACRDAVARLHLSDNVRFEGYSDRTADWYRAVDMVLLASQREGLPRCMIESIACGALFASFDVCSTREILEGHDCGVVVPAGDHVALADAAIALLDDPRRADRHRANGPVVARHLFDAAQNGADYKGLLDALAPSTSHATQA